LLFYFKGKTGYFDERYHWACTTGGQRKRYRTDDGGIANLTFHEDLSQAEETEIRNDILKAREPRKPLPKEDRALVNTRRKIRRAAARKEGAIKRKAEEKKLKKKDSKGKKKAKSTTDGDDDDMDADGDVDDELVDMDVDA
jgi:hypothetical protein